MQELLNSLNNLPFNYEEAVAVILFAIGLSMLLFCRNLLKKVIGLDVMDAGIFLLLADRGYITGRPSIGISGATLTERDAAFYGLKERMYVEFVHPYSDAFRKGLQAGDVIVAMNGTSLTSTEEIKKIY